MMQRSVQMSESIRLGILLALSGGFMDAYSYIERGHVFANAQTGNILLFGVHLSEGNLPLAVHYFIPVFAFAFGIALAEMVHLKKVPLLHWRQISVLLEAVILLGVSFFPQNFNLPANVLTSFACGIQVESFRKIHGNGIATTMCIGNLRSATQNLFQYIHTKKAVHLKNSLLYYGIIFFFVIGAVSANFFIQMWKERAIICSSLLLFLAFLLMFFNHENPEENGGD